jgi:hypothetical protein
MKYFNRRKSASAFLKFKLKFASSSFEKRRVTSHWHKVRRSENPQSVAWRRRVLEDGRSRQTATRLVLMVRWAKQNKVVETAIFGNRKVDNVIIVVDRQATYDASEHTFLTHQSFDII